VHTRPLPSAIIRCCVCTHTPCPPPRRKLASPLAFWPGARAPRYSWCEVSRRPRPPPHHCCASPRLQVPASPASPFASLAQGVGSAARSIRSALSTELRSAGGRLSTAAGRDRGYTRADAGPEAESGGGGGGEGAGAAGAGWGDGGARRWGSDAARPMLWPAGGSRDRWEGEEEDEGQWGVAPAAGVGSGSWAGGRRPAKL
jgi:hypothetical protein